MATAAPVAGAAGLGLTVTPSTGLAPGGTWSTGAPFTVLGTPTVTVQVTGTPSLGEGLGVCDGQNRSGSHNGTNFPPIIVDDCDFESVGGVGIGNVPPAGGSIPVTLLPFTCSGDTPPSAPSGAENPVGTVALAIARPALPGNVIDAYVELHYDCSGSTLPGVSGTTPDGGVLSTGPLPSASHPLTTSVLTPVGGFVQLTESTTSVPTPIGYQLFGQQVAITAPTQAATSPLGLVFQLDGSIVAGLPLNLIKVWRNGALVPNCVGGASATTANPDPCMKPTTALAGGGARITALSSAASVWTFGKLIAVAPGAPSAVVASPGVRSAAVTWAPPSSDGGAPIRSYTVTATPIPASIPIGVTAKARSVTVTGTPPTPSTTITSLVNGVSYTVAVKAQNALVAAFGPASAPSNVATVFGVPGAPTITDVVAGANSAAVSWSAPASDSAITKYTVKATATRPDLTVQTVTKTVLGAPPATALTIAGLTPNLDYSFTVSATSAVGTGAASAPAGPVTPAVGISITSRSLTEGNSGTKNFSFTVKLSSKSTTPLTVDVSTADGTAHASDYVPLTTTLTFTPGQTTRNVVVAVSGDTAFELDEVFSVNLTNPSTGIITVAQGVGTILNDDVGTPAIQVAAGGVHTCALMSGGTVKCWGANYHSQLGNGTSGNLGPTSTPGDVIGVAGATQLALGYYHSCALVAGGNVKCWGYNGIGAVGDGTNVDRDTAVDVLGVTGATEISAGEEHTCALINDGTVKCWGHNGYGQIGIGSNTFRSDAAAVLGVTGATHIGVDMNASCAIVAGGAVKCWGQGTNGQLGNGTTVSSNVAVDVLGVTDAIQITGGYGHTCVLVLTGGVKCWGLNSVGELGTGSNVDTSVAVDVPGVSGATQISSGTEFTCALVAGGAVKCWGSNGYGELGDGDTINVNAPVDVVGVSAIQMATGSEHACAVVTGGFIKCWGRNDYGMLGNGVAAVGNAPTPLAVDVIGIP